MRQIIYRVSLDTDALTFGTLGDYETFVSEAESFDIDPDTPVTRDPNPYDSYGFGRLKVERIEDVDEADFDADLHVSMRGLRYPRGLLHDAERRRLAADLQAMRAADAQGNPGRSPGEPVMPLSIAPVLEHYGARFSVPMAGWHSIRCPFHDDHTASGSVSLECNAFICFRCGMRGDVIKIIELQEHVGFEAACEYIAETFGSDFSSVPQAVHESARRRKRNREGWKKVPRRSWD